MTQCVVLQGKRAIAASASGRAVIVSDFRRPIPAGHIVVARHGTPDVIFVMEEAVGLVFEAGGPASHAAILAREMGVACIVGVAGLMSVVTPNARIAINGDSGEVRVIHD
ncbi:MAG: pyruvate, water dikinase [Solirubrobacteraceae bacterium]|jgi:pyruvate,water dikinase|nr:pyruvate, water dikinase [Solirubrobacteraceae bacterium]